MPSDVLFVATNLVDRFLTKMRVRPKHMACISVGSFLLAVRQLKLNINDTDDLVSISQVIYHIILYIFFQSRGLVVSFLTNIFRGIMILFSSFLFSLIFRAQSLTFKSVDVVVLQYQNSLISFSTPTGYNDTLEI